MGEELKDATLNVYLMSGEILPPRHERFARNVAGGRLSKNEAYRDAYPKARQWSTNVVGVQANALLKRPKVRQRVAELIREYADAAKIDAVRVLKEVERIAFLDPRKLFNADGSIVPVSKIDDDTAGVIASLVVIEGENGRTTRIRFCDKLRSLEMLLRHLGMYEKCNHRSSDVIMALAAFIAERTDGESRLPIADEEYRERRKRQ